VSDAVPAVDPGPPARLGDGRVLVDALSARLGGGLSYLTNQLVALEAVAPDLELHVLAAPANVVPLRAALHAGITVVPGGRLRPVVEQLRLPAWGGAGDVLYCPGNFAPLLPARARVVLTLQNPNYFGAGRLAPHNRSIDRTARSRLARWSAARADRVVVISQALRDALALDLPEVAARSDLLLSGGPTWPEDPVRPVALPPGREAFFLVLANDAPHKHIDRTVAAWDTAFGGAVADAPDLVVAGRFFDRGRAYAQRALVRPELRSRFHQLGGVTARAEVRWLLDNARALVSVASLEAHPLTPAEAGSLGCPLLLSDIAAHREVAGDHARYVPATTVGADEPDLVRALRDLGTTPAPRAPWTWPVTWEDNAAQLAAILRDELGRAETPPSRSAPHRGPHLGPSSS
jgi:glycosyltransferase involved in cell wall biosynthesis